MDQESPPTADELDTLLFRSLRFQYVARIDSSDSSLRSIDRCQPGELDDPNGEPSGRLRRRGCDA